LLATTVDAKVILKIDSKILVDLWNSQIFDRSEVATILADIQELSSCFSSFSIVFVKRHANWAAHRCAQEALRHRNNFDWECPPMFLFQTLQHDCNSYAYD
jgi:hypothetical protein